jgi:2-succinyl-5-enolpyruvyl-6-hydroxy-3-cyclohexene-1-carboxylate synthase
MKNASVVKKSLEWLWSAGVREICLCPGGRNSPFVVALEKENPFQIHTGFDERAVGFYALGRAQKTQSPVAVIVTSGTAVAELLPAVMEAFYTRTPLVVISADRPRRMRGTGAPQTVEQVGIFTSYVEKCVDMEGDFIEPQWKQHTTMHLNICFDEPLLDAEGETFQRPVAIPNTMPDTVTGGWPPVSIANNPSQEPKVPSLEAEAAWMQFRKKSQRALVVVSTLTTSEIPVVRKWLARWPGWVYAEGTSGLREMPHPGMILSGDKRVQQMLSLGQVDSVIRFGGVPTARAWRNLEKLDIPVYSLSRRPFAGLSRGEFFCVHLEETLIKLTPPLFDEKYFESAKEKDSFYLQKRQELLARYPQSEPALVHSLSRQILADGNRGSVYVGNSLPIREWDGFATREAEILVQANRGANGIDGQLSTALGFLQPQKTLWVLLGDLTTLYDANALWFWQKTPHPLKLVVLNNSGGKIFERLYNKKIFYNEHRIHFEEWAKMWGLPKNDCIELVPSDEQTQQFWRDDDQLWETLP